MCLKFVRNKKKMLAYECCEGASCGAGDIQFIHCYWSRGLLMGSLQVCLDSSRRQYILQLWKSSRYSFNWTEKTLWSVPVTLDCPNSRALAERDLGLNNVPELSRSEAMHELSRSEAMLQLELGVMVLTRRCDVVMVCAFMRFSSWRRESSWSPNKCNGAPPSHMP